MALIIGALLMAYIDFVSLLHKKTKRDYLGRVNEFPKAEAAKLAKQFGKDYWDGDRKVGYGGMRRLSRPIERLAAAVESAGANADAAAIPAVAGAGAEIERLANGLRHMHAAQVERPAKLAQQPLNLHVYVPGLGNEQPPGDSFDRGRPANVVPTIGPDRGHDEIEQRVVIAIVRAQSAVLRRHDEIVNRHRRQVRSRGSEHPDG
jgi:hypothetical protein